MKYDARIDLEMRKIERGLVRTSLSPDDAAAVLRERYEYYRRRYESAVSEGGRVPQTIEQLYISKEAYRRLLAEREDE